MKTKTRTQIVYKILFKHSGKLFSWSPPKGCRQEYSTTRTNVPLIANSGMFVFTNLESAREFDKCTSKLKKIFRCEATGVKKIKYRVGIDEDKTRVEKFWIKEPLSRKRSVLLRKIADKNIRVCKTLKLLEEAI